MLPHINDIDLMWHYSNELAIPDGHQPPSQLPAEFHSRVEVYEIRDSEYPGYVYLPLSYILAEDVHSGRSKYHAEQYDGDHWYRPRPRWDVSPINKQWKHMVELEFDGPALNVCDISSDTDNGRLKRHFSDLVPSVRCLSWPTQAANWPKRHRNYR